MRTARSLTMGGVPDRRGVPAQGVYLTRVPAQREGVPAQGGVPAWGEGYLPRYSPTPGEQNSWHTLLKIFPCPNFVAGGKNKNIMPWGVL